MSKPNHRQSLNIFCFVMILFLVIPAIPEDRGVAAVDDSQNILSERDRARVMNEWLKCSLYVRPARSATRSAKSRHI